MVYLGARLPLYEHLVSMEVSSEVQVAISSIASEHRR